MLERRAVELELGSIPPSCLGPDGKFREDTEEERRKTHRVGATATTRHCGNPKRPR